MRIEEFGAWKAARELAAEVYRVTRDGLFTADATLRLETRDRAVSIMTNLASGYAQPSCPEFRERLNEAAGSAGELESLIYLAEDAGFLIQDSSDRLRRRVADVRRLIDHVRHAVMRYEGLEGGEEERRS
jgi:four helix bundle protein